MSGFARSQGTRRGYRLGGHFRNSRRRHSQARKSIVTVTNDVRGVNLPPPIPVVGMASVDNRHPDRFDPDPAEPGHRRVPGIRLRCTNELHGLFFRLIRRTLSDEYDPSILRAALVAFARPSLA